MRLIGRDVSAPPIDGETDLGGVLRGRLAENVGQASADQPPTVAFVAPGWPRERFCNGIVTYINNMREALRRRDARVYVLPQLFEESEPDGDVVPLRCFDQPTSLLGRAKLKLQRLMLAEPGDQRVGQAIVRTARRLRARGDLSVLQMEDSFGWARFVAGRCDVPLIVRLHGPWFLVGPAVGVPDDELFRQRVRHESQAIALAQGITAPSLAVLDAVREYLNEPLEHGRVIPNPIAPVPESERWSAEACEPRQILFVGRFDRCKGGDVMVRAMGRVLETHRDARLTFVGPDQGFIDDTGRQHDLVGYLAKHLPGEQAERVEWLGFQPQSKLRALRQRANVVVVPSRFETFGNTAIEALAMGCPVIASNVGGLAEIVQHERNGLQVQAGDDVQLAEQIRRVFDDPSLVDRLTRQAVTDCLERYHPDVIADQTIAYYRQLADA